MTSSSTDEGGGLPIASGVATSNGITEKDILYAYVWHLLTRARVRGADNSRDPTDPTEVVKLFTTVDVHDASLPLRFGPPRRGSNLDCLNKGVPSPLSAIATAPLYQFFLQPATTDETAIPRLRRYALLASAIRSAIGEAVRKPDAVNTRLGLLELVQHEAQGQGQGLLGLGQEVAPRWATMGAQSDLLEGNGEGRLCIVSLDEAGRRGSGELGYGRRSSEVGSLSSWNSSSEKKEMGVEILTVTECKPSTPARGEYHAVVLPVREVDEKWKVQLTLHQLDRQWLRRWMEENPGEAAEVVPRAR